MLSVANKAFQIGLPTLMGTLWLGLSLALIVIFLKRITRGDFEERYSLANWALWAFLFLFVMGPIYHALDPSAYTLSQSGFGGQPEMVLLSFLLYTSHALVGALLGLFSLAKSEGAYFRPILGMIPLLLLVVDLILKVQMVRFVPQIPEFLPV